MTRLLSEDEQRVWRDFLAVQTRLSAAIGAQLQQAAGMSEPDFAVLVVLSEAPDGRVRAFEAGRLLQWEKSRLSHHLTRMERRGLVARESCGTDRRGAFIVLTPSGREAIEAAAPDHVEHVRRLFFDVLGPEQVAALGNACGSLLASLGGDGCSPQPDCDEAVTPSG